MGIQVVYVPIGVGTYHMETAADLFARSAAALKKISDDVVVPEKVLLTVDEAASYLTGKNPDLVILQNITFANAAYASEVLRRFDCPITLWTLREPVIDGGRLRSNSLTGAYSAANTIAAFRGAGKFEFVFGSPEEENVVSELTAIISACKVKKALSTLKMSAIGHTPQGFGFGRALDAEILKVFGVSLEAIEARELINKAKAYSDEDCAQDLEEAKQKVVGLEAMPEKNIKDFARLYKAYKSYITEGGIGAVSSRCWPDFFTSFGTPVCMVLSLLNAMQVPASCEADVYGALSMYIGTQFTGQSTFFGDPVAMDEKEGTITYWHCGMSEEATIFRIGRKPDGTLRFMIAEGEVLDKPKQFNGTSIVVKTDTPSDEIVRNTIKNGWEPHYVVVYKRIGNELEKLAHMLDLEIERY